MYSLHIESGIARLRLERPEARNAISVEGWTQIADAAEGAVKDGAHVLTLCGEAGGAFSAGADLREFDGFRGNAVARANFRQAMRSGIDRFRDLPVPTIAVIEGACFGAGLALAMACDMRFATREASFAITPAKLGISYPQEDVHRLVALVGAGQAGRLLLTAGRIGGAEAERIGLVERCIESGFADAVEDICKAISANDPESLRALKNAVRLAAAGVCHDETQDRLFNDLLGSAAMAERLEAHRNRAR